MTYLDVGDGAGDGGGGAECLTQTLQVQHTEGGALYGAELPPGVRVVARRAQRPVREPHDVVYPVWRTVGSV